MLPGDGGGGCTLEKLFERVLFLFNTVDTVSRRKRQDGYQLCPNSYMKKNCPPNDWVIRCKFVVSGSTCVYWMTCTVPISNVGNDLKNCNFSHDWSAVMCCKPTCPTG
jgi:hypothetical protein